MGDATCTSDGRWERFWSKVDAGGVCWEWTASRTSRGYGMFRLYPRENHKLAHRVAWEFLVGPIPEGLELDHLCRNTGCVNPDHLEPVTQLENLMRSGAWSAVNARKTHCPRGHEYNATNTRFYRGHRNCRVCDRARLARRRKAA